MYGAAILNNDMKWRVGDGTRVKFWTDTWIGDVPLVDTNFPLSDQFDKTETVSNYFSRTGWNIKKLLQALLPEVVKQIISIHVDVEGNLPDTCIWVPLQMDWLKENLCYNAGHIRNLKWCNIFVVACWFIWKWRCCSIFEPDLATVEYLLEWDKANNLFKKATSQTQMFLAWHSPRCGFFKLNIDGSRVSNSAGCIAAELGLHQIIVNSDSALVVDMINGDWVDSHPMSVLLTKCRELWKSQHYYVSLFARRNIARRRITRRANHTCATKTTIRRAIHWKFAPPNFFVAQNVYVRQNNFSSRKQS
ncbi:unnamed protein product [Prunus armeniaca]